MGAGGTLSVAVGHAGPVVVLTAEGEVDAATVGTLETALEGVIRDHESHVVIDACRVTFIDSTGISSLIGGLRRLNRSRRRLAVACGTAGAVGRALEVTGLNHTFECHATPEAAIGALADAPLIGR